MNILYIAYSCNPYTGSEDKIGWNAPYESAKTNNVWVITKEESRKAIEEYLNKYSVENMKFIYIDLPNLYKKIFNGFMYSGRLNIFHKRAYPIVKRICEMHNIDIIHQITPIEFGAIGNYGKIPHIKFICGPIGGGGESTKRIERIYKKILDDRINKNHNELFWKVKTQIIWKIEKV